MKKFGLIGKNISYSKSPELHKNISIHLNHSLSYDLIDIKEEEIKTYINKLKNNEYNGFNVTIPYKEKVIKYIDKLTPKAKAIGAVNTIYLNELNEVVGDNTDYEGFRELLLRFSYRKEDKVIILGTGGASKAVSRVLEDMNIKYMLISRTKTNLTYTYEELNNINFDLIINATPIGSLNYKDLSPVMKELSENKKVIDLIYNPKTTKLMNNSKYAINGAIMLIAQAYHAQLKWFNKKHNNDILNELINKMKDDL